MNNLELKKYIQNQISQGWQRLEGYTKDIQGNKLLQRSAYLVLDKYTKNFYEKGADPRIIIMPGLRGMGKTTLIAQLFTNLYFKDIYKLYLSVDEIVKRFNANLWDTIDAYEELIGKNIEALDNPLFLFLDEIHYDQKWAAFLKTIYDRSKRVFVCCTGSAALLLREQINADLARRVFFVDVHPVNFTEYLMIKDGKFPISGLGKKIKDVILLSNNVKEAFEVLNTEKRNVNDYWLSINKLEIDNYLRFGTFPFTLKSKNDSLSFNYIGQMINKIIYLDIPQFSKFEIETLNKIEKILYLISDSLTVSVTSLSNAIEMKTDTLFSILKSLENAGVLIRVLPYGPHYKQVKKPSKYLFASPSLRFFFLGSRDSTKIFDVYKGSLFEDIIMMYLNRILPKYGSLSLTYDAVAGGADFIIRQINKKIVLEVGIGEKRIEQVKNTLERINGNYGILVSDSELEIVENKIIKLPIKYFLLM
jgi:hypothetical protein